MEPGLWLKRWEEGLIGWHQQDINPHLERAWPQLNIPQNTTVLVPLSGKSYYEPVFQVSLMRHDGSEFVYKLTRTS